MNKISDKEVELNLPGEAIELRITRIDNHALVYLNLNPIVDKVREGEGIDVNLKYDLTTDLRTGANFIFAAATNHTGPCSFRAKLIGRDPQGNETELYSWSDWHADGPNHDDYWKIFAHGAYIVHKNA